MSTLRRGCTFFAVLVVAACTRAEDGVEAVDVSGDPLVGDQVERICFRNTINGFSDWDGGEGIILLRGANDQYLVTLRSPCRIANRAQRVGFNTRFATSGCVQDNEPLFLSETPVPSRTAFSTQSCLIDAIYEYAVEDDATSEDDET